MKFNVHYALTCYRNTILDIPNNGKAAIKAYRRALRETAERLAAGLSVKNVTLWHGRKIVAQYVAPQNSLTA